MFSGQVVGETAKILSERFGKVLQKRQSMTINQREKSTSISTQMDSLIPASKISNLTQGMFVGAVADNFDERIEQKIFHCEIVVDNEKVKRETARYVKLPQIIDFTDKDGNDRMQEEIQANYDRIRQEVRQIVEDEITRIKNDPELCHLIREEEYGPLYIPLFSIETFPLRIDRFRKGREPWTNVEKNYRKSVARSAAY